MCPSSQAVGAPLEEIAVLVYNLVRIARARPGKASTELPHMVDPAKARLTVQGGPNSGLTVPLSSNPLTFGRRSDNDLVVDEVSVSRRHALIMGSPDGFILRDLNTTNGTFVNREKVAHAEYRLKHGDSVRLAGNPVSFLFREDGPKTKLLSPAPTPTGIVVQGEGVQEASDEGLPEDSLAGSDADLFRLLKSKKRAVCSREEIILDIWPELGLGSRANQALEESTARIRDALGDESSDPAHLITVGEFGYLLL